MRTLAFLTISQIGIHYRRSSLSETQAGLPDGAPQAGDRFPWLRLKLLSNTPAEDLFARLDDTRFNLIVIGQPLPADLPELSGLIHVLLIPDDPINDRELVRAAIPKPSSYLLRPDGHIGLAGTHLHAATSDPLPRRAPSASDSRRVTVTTRSYIVYVCKTTGRYPEMG